MSIIIETDDSGSVTFGSQGGSRDLVMFFDGYDDPDVVKDLAVSLTGPTINGLIKNSVKVDPQGGRAWKVTLTYATTGVGGGDWPLGGPTGDGSLPPSSPSGDPGGGDASDSTELKQGFSFGIAFNSRKLTQSIATISSTTDGIDPVKDFKRAIGVGQDGKVEGCEVPATPKTVFKITKAQAVVTVGYFKALKAACGTVNNATFYSQAAGEVLYLGCDADYQKDDGWSLTHHFGCEDNEVNIEVCDTITIPARKGWEYLWVAYKEIKDGNGLITTIPYQANVEQVFKTSNFANIRCGK